MLVLDTIVFFQVYYGSDRCLNKKYLELIQLLIEKNHISNSAVYSIYETYDFMRASIETKEFAPAFFDIINVIPRVKLQHALYQGHDHFEKIVLNYIGDPTVTDYLLDLEKDRPGNPRLNAFKDWWLQSKVRKQFYAGKTESVNEEKTSQRSPLLNNHFLANLQNTNNHDQSVPRTEVYFAPHRTIF